MNIQSDETFIDDGYVQYLGLSSFYNVVPMPGKIEFRIINKENIYIKLHNRIFGVIYKKIYYNHFLKKEVRLYSTTEKSLSTSDI